MFFSGNGAEGIWKPSPLARVGTSNWEHWAVDPVCSLCRGSWHGLSEEGGNKKDCA